MTTNSIMGKGEDDGCSNGEFPPSAHDAEGIVHGHIHNYDNMTYIHGHVHRGHQHQLEDVEYNRLLEPQDGLAPSVSLAMSNEDFCRKYVDCQHFEFVNYHTAKQLSETIGNNAFGVCGGIGGNVNENDNDVSDKVGAFNGNINGASDQGSSTVSGGLAEDQLLNKGGDEMLMPASKKRTFSDVINNVTGDVGSDCNCNPKILEVCCDMDHVPSSVPTEEGLLDRISPAANDDLVVCTGVGDNIMMPPAANEYIPRNELSEISCDLTCVCPPQGSQQNWAYYEKRQEEEEEEEEYDDDDDDDGKQTEDDIFEKFCKECVNLNQQKSQAGHHNHHQHHHGYQQYLGEFDRRSSSQNSVVTPSSTPSASLEEGSQKGNSVTNVLPRQNSINNHSAVCHDHVVNSQMDLKILDDLCDISSLYEFPFANHMNHHNHSHNDIYGHSNQGVNLLQSSIDGNASNGQGDSGTHHHHRIQFHQHKPQQLASKELNPRDSFPWGQSERIAPNLKIEEDRASVLHHHHSPKLSSSNFESEANTINFNWSFKNEDSGQLKCEWDTCLKEFPSLIDLQKHMFKDHVPQERVASNLSCNWNDCEFKGDDVCSLVNHINSDHGINFGMKVLDNASLLEQREQHHLLHCPDHFEETVAPPCKMTKLQCQWAGCDHWFSEAEELSNHLEKSHLPKGKSEYHCYWKGCCRKFTQRQKMVRHLKVHSGYKPYKCQVCFKSFSSEDTLNQHMRTHSGEKPFECDICGKRFSVSSSLKIHIRTHTGEKPLQCKICGKRFNESSNLNKHLKTHRKKYKCNYCIRSFESEDKFKAHELVCCNAPFKLRQVQI